MAYILQPILYAVAMNPTFITVTLATVTLPLVSSLVSSLILRPIVSIVTSGWSQNQHTDLNSIHIELVEIRLKLDNLQKMNKMNEIT